MEKAVKIKKLKNTTLSPLTIALMSVLILYVASMCLLFVWALNSAFQDPTIYGSKYNKYTSIKFAWPIKILSNVKDVFQNAGYLGYDLVGLFLNSVLYAVGCSFAKAAVTCLTAYLCARYAYKFSKVVYTIVIVSMSMPIVGSLPSEIEMAHRLGIYNQIWGLWIMRCSFLGMYFLVFHEFFKALPKSYTEAAELDGASDMSIMLRIAFPLVKYTFLSVMLIHFIEYWNEYQIPLALMPEKPTAAYALFIYYNTGGDNTGDINLQQAPYIITMGFLIVLPILVIFIACNKQLMGNLSVGGIKG